MYKTAILPYDFKCRYVLVIDLCSKSSLTVSRQNEASEKLSEMLS